MRLYKIIRNSDGQVVFQGKLSELKTYFNVDPKKNVVVKSFLAKVQKVLGDKYTLSTEEYSSLTLPKDLTE
jgi:hypothetical protein